MLGTILNLFGKSPFAPLQSHMEKTSLCVHLLPQLIDALENKQEGELNKIAETIAKIEHEADFIKNNIRNHLLKSLYLPIDKSHILEILSLQDQIADKAEDIAVLMTLKPLELPAPFAPEFKEFLRMNLATFDVALQIINEMHELLESSFGGIEAEKVKKMIDEVCLKEHEVDLIQRQLLRKFYKAENFMTYTTFYLWQKIFEAISALSNLSENLALRVRMTLEIK